MFAEPITLTFAAPIGATALKRVGYNPGKFQSADGNIVLTISHSATKNNRLRSVIRLDRSIVAVDPLVSTLTRRVKDTVYVVLDSASSATGVTNTMREDTLSALNAYLTTGTVRAALLGGES